MTKKITWILIVIFLSIFYTGYKMTRIYYSYWNGEQLDVTTYIENNQYYLYKYPKYKNAEHMIKSKPLPFPTEAFKKTLEHKKIKTNNDNLLDLISQEHPDWVNHIGYTHSDYLGHGYFYHFFMGTYSINGKPYYITILHDEQDNTFDPVEIQETINAEYKNGPTAAYQYFVKQAREQAKKRSASLQQSLERQLGRF